MKKIETAASELLSEHREKLNDLWRAHLITQSRAMVEALGLKTVETLSSEIIDTLIRALSEGDDINSPAYDKIKANLKTVSRNLSQGNFSPSDTAIFIFSLKTVVFPLFQQERAEDQTLADQIMLFNRVVDKLGLYTFEVFLESREALIREQQSAFMEVSVPVVKIWDNIIMIPLVGILDSARTQLMMETMLTAIEENQSKIAIIDISGIPIVDSLVARHLITAASAARLMGAECLITGIRSKISQTLVQLGVDLGGFTTRTTLSDGLKLALRMTEQTIV